MPSAHDTCTILHAYTPTKLQLNHYDTQYELPFFGIWILISLLVRDGKFYKRTAKGEEEKISMISLQMQ